MSEIPLSSSMKSSLLSLQKTQSLYDITQEHLTSGKRVNSPMDNPASYFASATLTERANDLDSRLDSMGQAVQSVKAADAGIEAIRSILDNMKAVISNTLTEEDSNTRRAMGKTYNKLLIQLQGFAEDSAYGGTNLLRDEESINVQLGQKFDDSVYEIQGFHVAGAGSVASGNGEVSGLGTDDIPSSWGVGTAASDATNISQYAFAINKIEDPTTIIGLKGFGTDDTTASGHEIDWGSTDYYENLNEQIAKLEAIDEVLQTRQRLFTYDQSTITLREEYTQEFINTLEDGSDELVLADLNEESANLLSLQTQQSLGVQTLSISNQQTQSILQLLG